MKVLEKKKRFTAVINLGLEILPVYHKIYGQYHQRISDHMCFLCGLILIDRNFDKDEKSSFLKKTQDSVKITHRADHRIFILMKQLDYFKF